LKPPRSFRRLAFPAVRSKILADGFEKLNTHPRIDRTRALAPRAAVHEARNGMSSVEGARLPSAAAAATAPQPAPTEEARLLGDARRGATGKSPWRYLRRFARGEYVSYRVLTAIAFMAMGAVALVLNVTVERVAQAPVSMNWIQSLAGQADPHLAAHLAAARTENASLNSEVLHPRRLGGRLHAELEEEEQEIALRRQLERGRLKRRARPAAALGVTPDETGSEAASSSISAASEPANSGMTKTENDDSSASQPPAPSVGQSDQDAPRQTFPEVALLAANRVRADDARCDLRPHRGPSHGDVFKCDAAMFDEARNAVSPNADADAFSPAHSATGTPAWPLETRLTRNEGSANALRSSVNACRRGTRVDFDKGEKDRPYALPADGTSVAEKSVDSSLTSARAFSNIAPNSAYVYAFLHVHKCAGTFVDNKLRVAAEKVRQKTQTLGDTSHPSRLPPNRHAGLFPNFPLMELSTPETRRFMAWTFANARPPPPSSSGDVVVPFAEEGRKVAETKKESDETVDDVVSSFGDYGATSLRARYDAGERLFVKSSEAMGFCDFVDAPCAYLTVLREPLERFMSYYAYICLLGAENREHWTEEWLAQGKCTADPAQFARVISPAGFSMVDLLAPGGDATGRSGCRLAAAKRNLVSGCTRYLLLDRLDEGLRRLAKAVPDLREFAKTEREKVPLLGEGRTEGQTAEEGARPNRFATVATGAAAASLGRVSLAEQNSVNGKNSARDALSEAQKALLARYEADESIMAELREYLKEDKEVYDFAVARYEEQWDKPLATC
jgi:hypothetical protein